MRLAAIELVRPTMEHVPSFRAALDRGYVISGVEPDGLRARIAHDVEAFLAEAEDRLAQGPPIVLPDGSRVARLPSITRWMWDGEYAGRISLRWQPGTVVLPPTCLGHIGYDVVPWKRRRGYARTALGLILIEANMLGLPFVEVVTDPSNRPSQAVIEANGGVLSERFEKPQAQGGGEGWRYRIALSTDA